MAAQYAARLACFSGEDDGKRSVGDMFRIAGEARLPFSLDHDFINL
jgi:hypothetical protein